MTYLSWFQNHGRKHAKIMKKLTHLNEEEVLRYFRFENMQKKEPDFCLLYAENKKCHEMKILNCYLCACPHFRFNDKGFHQERTEKERPKTVFSFCEIESKHGARFLSEKAIHHDCTGCKIPHNEGYIKKHFSRNWFEIMQKVSAKNDLIFS